MSLQALRSSRAQIAVMMAAMYLAKLVVVATLCVAASAAARAAETGGPGLPHFIVLCTPSGPSSVAFDMGDADGSGAPAHNDRSGVDCPVCAAHCKLPVLTVAALPDGTRTLAFERVVWRAPTEPAGPDRSYVAFHSRAPPARSI